MLKRWLSVALLLAGVILLAGCKSEEGTLTPTVHLEPTTTAVPFIIIPTPTSTAPAVVTPEEDAGETPQAPPSTPIPGGGPVGESQEGGALGSIWSLANVRYGVHEDRLRVVLEMAEPGSNVPKYRVVEVDNAATPFPTGHDPEWGAARLDVVISDLYARDYPLSERLPMTLEDDPVVTQIGQYPTFDDALLGFSIGLSSPATFEVHELTDPVRIVIDVLYP